MNLANKLTLSRILMVPLVLAAYYLPFDFSGIIAAGLFLIASLTDLFDGRIARKRGQITTFGKFMDPIADKLLVCAALLALCGDGRIHPVIVFAVIAREFIVSGVRLVAASGNTRSVIAASGLAKAKTVMQIICVIVLLLDNWPFFYLGIPMDQITIWVMLAWTIWSGVDYLIKYWGVIGETK